MEKEIYQQQLHGMFNQCIRLGMLMVIGMQSSAMLRNLQQEGWIMPRGYDKSMSKGCHRQYGSCTLSKAFHNHGWYTTMELRYPVIITYSIFSGQHVNP